MGSTQENLTEEEIVQKSKRAMDERKACIQKRKLEAEEEAKKDLLLREKLESLCDLVSEEMKHGREREERLFAFLEMMVKKIK